MAKITRLEDIEVYRDALVLAREVFTLCKHETLAHEYSLQDQIKRAAISVAANISEGYGRKTRKDFSQFLSIALGSANEVITYLDFIELTFSLKTGDLREKYDVVSRRIYRFRTYLVNSA